jgi:alkaline phosphatase
LLNVTGYIVSLFLIIFIISCTPALINPDGPQTTTTTIQTTQLKPVHVNPVMGIHGSDRIISMNHPDTNASIYYSIDTYLSEENLILYHTPITLEPGNHTIKSFARASDMTGSPVITVELDIRFRIYYHNPGWTPAVKIWEDGGRFISELMGYTGAGIPMTATPLRDWYYVDIPFEYLPLSNLHFMIDNNGIELERVPLSSGWYMSGTWYDSYPGDIEVPVVTSYPEPGTYNSEQMVMLSSSGFNNIIYYTTNGDLPGYNSEVYTAPVTISQSMTIKAVSENSNSLMGETSEFVYIIDSSADTIAPQINTTMAPGSYHSAITPVFTVLDDSNQTTVVYYTVDGSEPVLTSPVYIEGDASEGLSGSTITISNNCIVRMLAVDQSGNSREYSWNYQIGIQPKKTVILMIGDGMGFQHVAAARSFHLPQNRYFRFEMLDHSTDVTTNDASDDITDSAAAGTAMATGHKVNKLVLSKAIPGDHSDYKTILELYQEQGYRAGLITSMHVTNATPAAFASHQSNRFQYNDIGLDYRHVTFPRLLMGGGGFGVTTEQMENVGYQVVDSLDELPELTFSNGKAAALFGESNLPDEYNGDFTNTPHLTDLVSKGLSLMEKDGDPFFLMIESGKIDGAGHANNITGVIYETIEFSRAIDLVLDWAEGRNDVLILVTADHETGGLSIIQDNGQGNLPDVTWSTGGHTSTNVPIYGEGPGAELLTGTIDNTYIHTIMTTPM